jgi:hypothetical protein
MENPEDFRTPRQQMNQNLLNYLQLFTPQSQMYRLAEIPEDTEISFILMDDLPSTQIR